MKVKIGDTVYDAEEEPIMLILSWEDKLNLQHMAEDVLRYVSAPSSWSTEQIKAFMELD